MEQIKYYLAVDIGASSGRHILAHREGAVIVTEEIYRFPNGNDMLMIRGNAHRVWDIRRLFEEVLNGMKKCRELGKIPQSVSIDTWGVDYVLLDAAGQLAAPCYAYRDNRTEGMDKAVSKLITPARLYARTGIQKAIFNTIYQLTAARLQEPKTLEKAEKLLMIPDYLHYLLTGEARQEYTNASTTQLLDPVTRTWDYELIRLLGFPEKLFGSLTQPGETVGRLRPAVAEEVGFDTAVVACATHDTGSAVMSVPADGDDVLYISSGTWSLFGCELTQPDCRPAARRANFTNEGGYGGTIRFLKNIMGLWMIQSVRRELEERDPAGEYSFARLCDMASREEIASVVPANDGRFLAPESMIEEVQAACRESGQEVPQTPWEIARVIYRSLAVCYREALEELEAMNGRHYPAINIVGGGSNAAWLNRLTAQETGRTVLAGPAEATAIGNLGAQMIAAGEFADLKDFRRSVYQSFGVSRWTPDGQRR